MVAMLWFSQRPLPDGRGSDWIGEQVAMLAGESPAPLGCGFLNHRNNVDWKEWQAGPIGRADPQLAT